MRKPVCDFLLVDDDAVFTHVLQRALQKRNFHCQCASNITEALALLHLHQFRRAIIDLNLAGDSGLQLLREINQRGEKIETVMLTGYSSISTAVEAIKQGAINYLCKPADADEILLAFNMEPASASENKTAEFTPLSVERLEWEHIQKILQANAGNISATARALGMHRRTLQRKLQKRPVKH